MLQDTPNTAQKPPPTKPVALCFHTLVLAAVTLSTAKACPELVEGSLIAKSGEFLQSQASSERQQVIQTLTASFSNAYSQFESVLYRHKTPLSISNNGNFVHYSAMNKQQDIQTPRGRLMDRVHLRLYTINKNTLKPDGWNVRNVYSSFWRLYMNFRDGAQISFANKTMDLTANHIHFIPAWQRFSGRCHRLLDHFFIHFDIVGLPGTLVRNVFDQPITLQNTPQLVKQAKTLAQNTAAQPSLTDIFQSKALLYQAMAHLIDQLPTEKARRCDTYTQQVEPILPAIRYIDRAYGRSIHNNDLAQRCHLSVDYFIRRFRECVDQTPAQYILERRINAAAQQLVFTHDPIEKVAEDNGFNNRFYFSRMFTRLMGTPPAAYRKMGHI